MRNVWNIFLFLVILFSLIDIGNAGSITLKVGFEINETLRSNLQEIPINISIKNLGDEPCYNVHLRALTLGNLSDHLFVGRIDPLESVNFSSKIILRKDLLEGEYMLVFLISYKDANGYPFSAIVFRATPIIVEEPTLSDVNLFLETQPLEEGESSYINLTILNNAKEPREVKIRLFAPREIRVEKETLELYLDAKELKKLRVNIRNFGGLSGSKYVLLAYLEYIKDSKHFIAYSPGMVEITSKEKKSKHSSLSPLFDGKFIFILIFLLLLGLLLLQIKRK